MSTAGLTGLVTKSAAPSLMPRSSSSGSFMAVTKITGMSRVSGFLRSSASTMWPSMSGIMMSSRMRSGRGDSWARRRAVGPFLATRTSPPSSSTMVEMTTRLLGVSSTTRIIGFLPSMPISRLPLSIRHPSSLSTPASRAVPVSSVACPLRPVQTARPAFQGGAELSGNFASFVRAMLNSPWPRPEKFLRPW